MSTPTYSTDQQQFYRALLAGDEPAFEYLYTVVHHQVSGFVFASGGNRHDTKTVVHEAITALVFNIRYGTYEWREETQITSYVTGIARNKWNEMRRREARHVSFSDTTLPLLTDTGPQSAADEQDFDQRRAAVERGLLLLGDKCRQTIDLFYSQRKSMHEIAGLLGWANEHVAKKEKYRCLQKLRRLVGLTNWAD